MVTVDGSPLVRSPTGCRRMCSLRLGAREDATDEDVDSPVESLFTGTGEDVVAGGMDARVLAG
ncbi:hypothetical protein OG226_48865 [Streptomyces sp. NBC_01261]|uniref:hypothetical protein n=1 Tax=Streptomyces sp. NBC_01261 TaxID=2903802 RepID=UPI002E37BB37|nr:hypothetical protein [Streptomyces sp. NBC_01261]